MLTQSNLCLIILIMFNLSFLLKISATSIDIKQDDDKRSLADFYGRYAVDPNYLLTNRPYYGNDMDDNPMFFQKRHIKKKWNKLFERSHSPFTIAFPALIRTRRWIDQQE